jgi:cytochrome c oxidase assembly protein Cox11
MLAAANAAAASAPPAALAPSDSGGKTEAQEHVARGVGHGHRTAAPSDHPITGRAVYNVTPELAGAYFRKLECFCFSDQTVAARTTVEFPVVYFVDPKFAEDFNTRGKSEVTLSYTFYPAQNAKPTASGVPSALGGTAKAGL